MAESSSAYADSGAISDLDQLCDEGDFDSSASTTSEVEDCKIESQQSSGREVAVTKISVQCIRSVPTKETQIMNGDNESIKSTESPSANSDPERAEKPQTATRTLNLLDLPVDLLQDIIKEVTHTNDLTSLALTCSALHSLAIPQMYSRFDIVWPDAGSQPDQPAGVDALSYGLATLVMGEDIFRELPRTLTARPCSHCGCSNPQPPVQQDGRPVRRGNYFAQYTRKFSVGNGPPDWVQEYSVTKETGKMLGTLVALAVARMVNLETFVWDMPTGVVRDVWIALASLADRPGHACRLENVWIRWHDNSDSTMRPLSVPLSGVPTTSSLTLPETQNILIPPPASSSLLRKFGHVEYPSLSILPALKNLSVLDIDEPSYLEEMAVLVGRSRERLRELRIGISAKVHQAEWLKPQGGSHPEQPVVSSNISGWPRSGGALGAILGWPGCHTRESEAKQDPVQSDKPNVSPETPDPVNTLTEALSSQTLNSTETQILNGGEISCINSNHQAPTLKNPREALKRSSRASYSSSSHRQLLKLEVLELERVSISAPVLIETLDWTRVTTLTILFCEGHEKLWRALRRRFAPATTPRSGLKNGRKDGRAQDKSSPEYALRIKHLHTDAVSPYLLLFIKDTLPPDTLETVFLHGAPLHDSAVHIEAIYRNVIRTHRSSLRKLLVDSTARSTRGAEVGNARWRKWMFTREMITFMTSGRMSKLKELSITLDSRDWHYFLQRLPYIPQLRALHIPHFARPSHLDLKELAMQVLDIVTLRPEISLSYVGIQNKCFELLEGKGNEFEFAETDEAHSEGFVPGAENWPGSDTNEEDSDDDEEDAPDSHSDLSSEDRRSLDDDDASDFDSRPRVSFRLREILFYDDKIAIFKGRHGVL
ncbi:hypothetical protein BJY04DRAFT_213149 [Aspergillus karnatakaensis]|uniref:uncharacterized protein n=1 Tax=Aspergillus karnatakaensis TaxID=1810916 RepID=UPI003CCD285F